MIKTVSLSEGRALAAQGARVLQYRMDDENHMVCDVEVENDPAPTMPEVTEEPEETTDAGEEEE